MAILYCKKGNSELAATYREGIFIGVGLLLNNDIYIEYVGFLQYWYLPKMTTTLGWTVILFIV